MSAPPGWPQTVPAPEVAGWEKRAVAYLFDLCPAEHRAEPLLTKHPVVLARITGTHVGAALDAMRTGYGRARVELADVLSSEQIDQVLAFYESEGKRLREAQRAVALIESALRGTRFAERLT